MEKFNLKLIESLANTQHGDYGGYIQMDGHLGGEIHKLCRDHGISTDDYFVVGFQLSDSMISKIDSNSELYCSLILLEKDIYGNSFDEIQNYLVNNSGAAKAIRKTVSVKYSDLSKYFKRFDIAVLTGLSRNIAQLEIEDMEEDV